MQKHIDNLTETQHDHLNRFLMGVAFLLAVPLAMVAVPYIAGLFIQ